MDFEVYAEAEMWELESNAEERIAALLDDDNAVEKILDICTEAFVRGARAYWSYESGGSC